MKKSKEIINLPVISISEGIQIGTVKSLVINPQQKKSEFLILDDLDGDNELRGLSFLSAVAVGDFAVTVQNGNEIIDLQKISVLQDLVRKDIQLIGTNVVTKKGNFLGEVAEYSIHTESGELAEVYYDDTSGKEKSLAAASIITIGKEVLIVEDDSASAPAPSKEETGNFKKGDEGSAVLTPAAAAIEQEKVEIDTQVTVESDIPVFEAEGNLDPAEIFVRRQQQYLIGKTLFKDIKMDDGEIIAWENEIITEELFERVYQLGTQKLMELAMSVRE